MHVERYCPENKKATAMRPWPGWVKGRSAQLGEHLARLVLLRVIALLGHLGE
jgi:hypothetical protein